MSGSDDSRLSSRSSLGSGSSGRTDSSQSRMSQFGSELQWLHGDTDETSSNIAAEKIPTDEIAAARKSPSAADVIELKEDVKSVMEDVKEDKVVTEEPVEVKKTLHISAMIRSEISSKRFKIWENEIHKCSCPKELQPIKILGTFDKDRTTHVLLPEKCSGELFLTWSKLIEIPDRNENDFENDFEDIEGSDLALLGTNGIVGVKEVIGVKGVKEVRGGSDVNGVKGGSDVNGVKGISGVKGTSGGIRIVKSDWIVESLKAKMILKPNLYYHQLQSVRIPSSSEEQDSVTEIGNNNNGLPANSVVCSPLYGPGYTKAGVKAGSKDATGVNRNIHNDMDSNGSSSSSSSSSNSSGRLITDSSSSDKQSDGILIPINKNKHITDILNEMTVFYDLLGDNFREMVYNRCCGIIERYPVKITDIKEIIKLPGVGKSLADKISEILKTGKLEKLEGFKKDQKLCALITLGKIWGVGPKGAKDLYEKGMRTVEDVRERGERWLNAQQKTGLLRFEDLQQRIPRDEVREIEKIVREHAERLVPGIQMVVCGSYRRGAVTCGDVDVLFAPPEGEEYVDILPALIASLSEIGFLTDHLAMPHSYSHSHSPSKGGKGENKGRDEGRGEVRGERGGGDIIEVINTSNKRSRGDTSSRPDNSAAIGNNIIDNYNLRDLEKKISTEVTTRDEVTHSGRSSYMGICRLPGEHSLYRRIDLKSYRRSQFPFAILYFTGPDHFNRAIRNHAGLIGYSLSDTGLVSAVFGSNRQQVVKSVKSIPCKTEEDIFTALGLSYKNPEARTFFLSPSTVTANTGHNNSHAGYSKQPVRSA